MGRVWPQEDLQGQDGHGQPAPPAEEVAIAEQVRALVVVLAQFSPECRRGDFVEGDQAAHDDRRGQQVQEQLLLAQPVRRSPEEVEGQRGRRTCEIHERVPATPPAAPVVTDEAHQRVQHAVNGQRQQDGQPAEIGGQAQNLIVEQQEKGLEAVVLHPVGHRAEAVGNLREQPGSRAGRCRSGHCRPTRRSDLTSCDLAPIRISPSVVADPRGLRLAVIRSLRELSAERHAPSDWPGTVPRSSRRRQRCRQTGFSGTSQVTGTGQLGAVQRRIRVLRKRT